MKFLHYSELLAIVLSMSTLLYSIILVISKRRTLNKLAKWLSEISDFQILTWQFFVDTDTPQQVDVLTVGKRSAVAERITVRCIFV